MDCWIELEKETETLRGGINSENDIKWTWLNVNKYQMDMTKCK